MIDLEPFAVPPVLYFDLAEEDRLYTLLFLEFGHHGRHYLRWHVANLSGALLLQGMTYMDGDTALDYLPPVPRSSSTDVDDAADDDADDDDVDGQPARYGFYLYEQVYGTIYLPTPAGSSDDRFDLDAWIGAIYREGALCGPVASIGFGAYASQPVTAS
ncbi:uncharacterized protein LOC126572864 [Anopheles aquasalis]|uniref:uncharacterized protein LOC126572864 n=1 Tax=Anopheles aquasalis TaxID=42839 RepID=UPI00215A4976|nr:uncharacterized protein LOC126572864 [Anopheles aquasalis]